MKPLYSRQLALDLLDLCEAAYVLAHTGACVLPTGFSPAVPFRMPINARPPVLAHDDLDIWGFVTSRDGNHYVVFRGTQNGPEWVADARALPMRHLAKGSIHGGFWSIFEAISASVLACLPDQSTADVIVTGHSLGAALATIFACEFETAGGITFAGPRAVDSSLAALLWSRQTIRIMNVSDIVPKVPLDPPFRHGGFEVLVDGPGSAFDHTTAHALESYRVGLLKMPPDSHYLPETAKTFS